MVGILNDYTIPEWWSIFLTLKCSALYFDCIQNHFPSCIQVKASENEWLNYSQLSQDSFLHLLRLLQFFFQLKISTSFTSSSSDEHLTLTPALPKSSQAPHEKHIISSKPSFFLALCFPTNTDICWDLHLMPLSNSQTVPHAPCKT